ncbi:MAG: hypothetical protein FWD28_04875 [Treponema sp.]|nr:hypothetical protein [Treponema sp.]
MAGRYLKLVCIALFVLVIFGCKTKPLPVEEPKPAEVIPDTNVTGTWFLGDHRSMVIFQYRSDGTGCEINLNQVSNFSLTYRPFNYTITETAISISFLDSMRPSSITHNYSKPSENRLTIVNYIRGLSPTFVRQELTELEGLWRRENGDRVEYVFGGRNFLLKLQNGIPTATGNFIVSDRSVTINDLYRCTDYFALRWAPSQTPHENYSFRINDSRLTLTAPGRDLLFVK